jgi:translocation and assembly module TamA
LRLLILRVLLLAGIAACIPQTACAADIVAYRIERAPTGNEAIDATLAASSELDSLRASAPVSPFGLIARARSDRDRLKAVLESFGYYQSRVQIAINGAALDDPRLGEQLFALPSDRVALVAVGFELGALYHLRHVDIDGAVPQAARSAFGLAEGDAAAAAAVLAAGARLLTSLQEQGYAFAKVDPPVAYEDAVDPVLDVSFHVVAGVPVKVGDIHIMGLQRVHERLVRARLLLHTGDAYRPSEVERARRDLLGLEVFAAISVEVGADVDTTGGVPITFVMRERARHAVSFNTAYSSDLGGSLGAAWTDRDVLGGAQQLSFAGALTNLGGSATTALGYNTGVKYLMPDFGRRDQSLQLAIGAVQQDLQAYDQTAVTTGITLNRKLSRDWSASAGVSTADERIVQNGQTYNYTLLALPLSVSYDSTHLGSPLDDPRHGMRNSVSITPTLSIGPKDATFTVNQLRLAGYVDVSPLLREDPGRSVLALRALAGVAQGAGEYSLPPDQRFYGGGSGTIRGYPYQSVSPSYFPDGNAVGGTAILAGTVELRQRIGAQFGAAAFVDVGQVGDGLIPLPKVFFIGLGVGLRYYTPIGPIRLDVALPTRHYSEDDTPFQLYIGLGQAF